jgi:hypothetical protein
LYRYNSGKIESCPRGSWQNETNNAGCKSCDAGSICTDCDKVGATASNCTVGFFCFFCVTGRETLSFFVFVFSPRARRAHLDLQSRRQTRVHASNTHLSSERKPYCTVCPAGTIYLAATEKKNATATEYKFQGAGTKEGVKCALSPQQDTWTTAVGSKALTTCGFGTTFAYDKVTGESLWGKTVGTVSYAPNLDLTATCVSECFAGESNTTAKQTMSPYYGTCIALPTEVSGVAPNRGVGEYGIAKCGVNTFVNATGKCEACPANTFSRYGTLLDCIDCPPKTGRNVTDEFCTALTINKKCDAVTQISVPDVLNAGPNPNPHGGGDYASYDGLLKNMLDKHSVKNSGKQPRHCWWFMHPSIFGNAVENTNYPHMAGFASRICPGWGTKSPADTPGTDNDDVFGMMNHLWTKNSIASTYYQMAFFSGACSYEAMLSDPKNTRCAPNVRMHDELYDYDDSTTAVKEGPGSGKYGPKKALKDTCAEMTPDRCLNAIVATACQETCKITPSPRVALQRPAIKYLGTITVAWPSNSLNYNPIITQAESAACPSTSNSAGKLYAAWWGRAAQVKRS